MIPSSPRRTWIFLLVSSLAFWGPDLLVPSSWQQTTLYTAIYDLYQGLLVVAGFLFGPAICRSMVENELRAGPMYQAVHQVLAELGQAPRLAVLPVTLIEHPAPFILTAGMLPGKSEVFVSSDLLVPLGPNGLRFLLARALVHGEWMQRLVALIPVLILTVAFPSLSDWRAWLDMTGWLTGWLALHWYFELSVDRKAARVMGPGAVQGLKEVMEATATQLSWLSFHPPERWRLQSVLRMESAPAD
jgi:Zn-dependent protease with chaperone function